MKKSIRLVGTMEMVQSKLKEMMEAKFNEVVNELQSNDRNASYDEILEECEGKIEVAYKILVECLKEMLGEFSKEDQNGEEYGYYKELLERL